MHPPPLRVIGIDPGTRHLGWGVVFREGNRCCHVGSGTIHTDTSAPLPQRLVQIERELESVIERFRPEVAAVETIFFHKDAQAAAKLGHARGVVMLTLARNGISIAEYEPARVKRTLAGRGRAEKRQVALMVRAVLGLEALPGEDATDALAVALTHSRVGGFAHATVEESGAVSAPVNPLRTAELEFRKRRAMHRVK